MINMSLLKKKERLYPETEFPEIELKCLDGKETKSMLQSLDK